MGIHVSPTQLGVEYQTMKMYSTVSPSTLLADATALLRREGFERGEIPQWRMTDCEARSGSFQITRDERVQSWWSTDLTLYTDQTNTVRSYHRPQHKTWGLLFDRDPDVYAATYQQWGLLLGALFDVAREWDGLESTSNGPIKSLIKVSAYNPTAKLALRVPGTGGAPYPDSAALFHYQTAHGFSDEMRKNGSVVLDCVRHEWQTFSRDNNSNGARTSRCHKCGVFRRD